MRRAWCEHQGCATYGQVVVWVDLGPLGTIPVWACRGCAAPYLADARYVAPLLR